MAAIRDQNGLVDRRRGLPYQTENRRRQGHAPMLIKLKFRFPEVFLGILLAVAIFAIGAAFSSQHAPKENAVSNSGPAGDLSSLVIRPSMCSLPYWRSRQLDSE
jgi:hypothetical protein